MFFPLGFGNWPRVFPFAIVIIVAICLAWSFQNFPKLEQFEKKYQSSVDKFEADNLNKLKSIFYDSCKVKFKTESECSTVAKALNADGYKLSAGITQNLMNTLGYQKYNVFVEFLNKFYRNTPKSWPKEARQHTYYSQYLKNYSQLEKSRKELSKEYDLSSYDNRSFSGLLKASFTHSGLAHLFGNLLFLIIFGIWVNQRMGSLWTAAVFMVGSFVGLFSHILVNQTSFVLGASAGISALMGSFFAFFYAAEFHFLFTFGFIYFKRLTIPIYWVFPAFYVAADFTALLSRESSGVAHLAHLAGLVVGLGLGFLHRKLNPVPNGHLFIGESILLEKLKSSFHPLETWSHYRDLMKWNLQNNEASKLFLQKSSIVGVQFKNNDELEVCKKYISQFITRCFRKSEVMELIETLETFPPQFSLTEMIKDVPLRQLLQTADYAAKKSHLNAALFLYQSAFPKLTNPLQAQAVNNSISIILQKQQSNQLKVSGG